MTVIYEVAGHHAVYVDAFAHVGLLLGSPSSAGQESAADLLGCGCDVEELEHALRERFGYEMDADETAERDGIPLVIGERLDGVRAYTLTAMIPVHGESDVDWEFRYGEPSEGELCQAALAEEAGVMITWGPTIERQDGERR